jgi:hypothetical protein
MDAGRSRLRKGLLFVLGLALGVILLALVARIWLGVGPEDRLRRLVDVRIDLPRDALHIEEIGPDRRLRITARNLAILDEAGDTIVAAPLARMVFDAFSLDGDEPARFTQVALEQPYVRLVQAPDGSWNLARAVRVDVDGRTVVAEDDPGRGIVFEDVRIENGRVLLATPWSPGDPGLGLPEDIQLARMGGATYRVRMARDVDGRLPLVRVGGPEGWRVEVDQLAARLTDPELRLVELRGFAEEAPGDGVRFAVDELRTDRSVLAGEGVVAFGDRPRLDVELRVAELAFADARWIYPELPDDGRASGVLSARTRADGRTEIAVRDAEVELLDSRVAGRLTGVVGGGRPATFRDTRLELQPLRLEDLRALGIGDQVPFEGEVRGVLATREETVPGEEAALEVDVVIVARPLEAPEVPFSELALQGPVQLFAPDAVIRFEGTRLTARPLHLAALRPFMEGDPPEGTLRGEVVLRGPPGDLGIEDGDLAYAPSAQVQPIRLVGLRGRVTTEPTLAFDLRADAQPLPLATLRELFPQLPFQAATVSGPIHVRGTMEEIRLTADLQGPAGAILVAGTLRPQEPFAFDLSGRVEAFRPGALIAARTPLEGPLTGTFAAAGTTRDFTFDVDLRHGEAGRFDLAGRLRQVDGLPPQFDVAGEVFDFRVGLLVGEPALLPSPVTGRIQVSGGGRQPYRYDVDLVGDVGAVQLAGHFAPGDVPAYSARGRVAGLAVHRVPGFQHLPATVLTGTVDLDGRGTTPETFAGRLAFDAAPGSVIAGIRTDRMTARVTAADGILYVQTLRAAFAGNQLEAAGTWGLTRPAPEPLHFAIESRDLAALAPLAPPVNGFVPELTGALSARGWIAGTVGEPVVSATVRGRNLRYDDVRFGRIDGQVELAFSAAEGIQGTITADAENARFAGMDFRTIRLTGVGEGDVLSAGLHARRADAAEVVLAGRFEVDGLRVDAVELEQLELRTPQVAWRLAQPALLRWGGVDGVHVRDLRLVTVDGTDGMIRIDGRLPPTGVNDVQIELIGVDVGALAAVLPQPPEIGGVVNLRAVIEGPVEAPEFWLAGTVDSLRFEQTTAERLVIRGAYAGQMLTLDTLEVWDQGTAIAVGSGRIPMELAFTGPIPRVELLREAPLFLQLTADSLPAGLVLGPLPFASDGAGALAGEVTVTGTIEAPSLAGWAAMTGGEVTLDPLGVRYREIEGRLSMAGNTVTVEELRVTSEGTASFSGTVVLEGDLPIVQLSGAFDNFRLADTPEFRRVTASGEIALTGRLPEPVLTGAVRVHDGVFQLPETGGEIEIDLVDLDIGAVGEDPVEVVGIFPPFLAGMRISDLEVSVGRSVWIENEELRAQIESDQVLVNLLPDGTWRVFGDVRVVRGTYRLEVGVITRRFDVREGAVRFLGTPDLNPSLDIIAAHEVLTGTDRGGFLTILVHVSGTIESPSIELTTDTQPPLPESEILSYLIFGMPSYQIGGDAGALAQQLIVGEVIGGLAAQQLEELFLPLGFDAVRVRGRPELGANLFGGTTIEASQQLTRNLYWTLEVGMGMLFGAAPVLGTSLTWLIDREWMARLAIEPARTDPILFGLGGGTDLEYQVSVEARRRWEFGHPRQPPPPVVGDGLDPEAVREERRLREPGPEPVTPRP